MKRLQLLKDTLEHMEYYNKMAPFPVYDTGDVEELKTYIKTMERETFIIVDELNNDICGRCGSVNEIEIHKDIFEYLDMKSKIDEDN